MKADIQGISVRHIRPIPYGHCSEERLAADHALSVDLVPSSEGPGTPPWQKRLPARALAGLNALFVLAQYGLYSSFVGCFVYCLLGTSKDVTLGPTAIMSLLVSSYAFHDPAYATLLAFLSGCIQLAMGLLHLGETRQPPLCHHFHAMHFVILFKRHASPMSVLSSYGLQSFALRVHVWACCILCLRPALCTHLHPLQVSCWTSFPTPSLQALRQLLQSPLASARSR